ncbi:hypothetical protein Ciccas_013571 [Cichlidogyrus casuarinus]|uniref:Uncharacterized protein n=1 Tax=Cichlidogyrus casuarinus TaxID=1844966 RepID=A0ABD2PK85_9PLAT
MSKSFSSSFLAEPGGSDGESVIEPISKISSDRLFRGSAPSTTFSASTNPKEQEMSLAELLPDVQDVEITRNYTGASRTEPLEAEPLINPISNCKVVNSEAQPSDGRERRQSAELEFDSSRSRSSKIFRSLRKFSSREKSTESKAKNKAKVKIFEKIFARPKYPKERSYKERSIISRKHSSFYENAEDDAARPVSFYENAFETNLLEVLCPSPS